MNSVVSLRAGITRGALSLQRTPKYLRFVMRGSDWKTLDALDQLDDVPEEGEHIIAAVIISESSVHIDGTRNGRRFGEWRRSLVYEMTPDQPTQESMRDAVKWQEWCCKNLKKESE